AKTLLDELIPYKIVSPSSEIDAPQIGAGALLVGMPDNYDALTELSKTIGVDLTNSNYRYALVKLNRLDGLDNHASAASGILVHARPKNPNPAYNLTEDFRSDAIKLRHGGKVRTHDCDGVLNVKTATQAIDSFGDYGTHYISSVQLGDTILQVFAYSQEDFERLKLAYSDGQNPLSGAGSQDFAQFTTNSNTGAFGYVADYGNIISLSNSEIFQTTLRNGDWLDTLWSHKNSIFSLFNSKSKLSLVQLEQQFEAQTVMQVQLASLSLMMEQKRGLIWQRVFKAAMVQKYSTNIEANFAIYDNRDFNSLLPEDSPGLISALATPTINLYKARLDLSQMQFVAEEEIENFILFCNVLMLSGNNEAAIPGSEVKLFGQILDLRTDDQPQKIRISDRAFDSLEIGCSEFLGALMIQNESGTKYSVIVDGIKFALENNEVSVDCDVRAVPHPDSLTQLVNSIQYSMTFAEAVMSDQTGRQRSLVQQLIGDYLQWLATIIPDTTVDQELLSLRIRVLDLANYAVDPNYGSFVPVLPAEEYDEYITSILDYLDRIQFQIAQNNQEIANRRLEELVIDVAETLNQNIIDTGNLVSGIIDVNVAQQKDMEGFYDALISQQEQEAQSQRIQINELRGLLFSAQGDVDVAVQQYKAAVERWQTITTIKFGLDVATNVFTLGTTIAIPASSIAAVEELGSTVQTIQKTLNVLNATSTLYTDAASDLKELQGAQAALDDLQGISFGITSTLAWDEMAVQFRQILATGPDVQQQKAALDAAFRILVLRGKAVTNAESSLHALERDIYTNQQQKQINTNQAARLSELQNNLDPQDIQDLDKSAIDLVGLTGYLEFIQNQMLTILAKAFLQKDLALQYENLQPATLIPSFSLLKFSAAIVQQNAATITAKSLLAQYQQTTTKSLDFVIPNVKPSELTNGAIRNATIFLDAPLFYSYVDVRVVSVVAKIDGVESTETGKYLLKLAYDGAPFHDRNIERDALNFRTPWR
ncbi:MAG: MAC/perforin domain-containing protein, partial [Cyanobacteria bacterium J06621_12]